jgi:hypothetical protein
VHGTRRAPVLCAVLLLPFVAGRAEAQMSVFPQQGLEFGVLVPGTPTVVPPTDVARRAVLEIVGSGQVSMQVVVPAALSSAGGRTLRLAFGPGSGIVRRKKSNQQTSFTPGTVVNFMIPPGHGGAWVWIGGTADPDPGQPPGRYTGQITVHLFTPGT